MRRFFLPGQELKAGGLVTLSTELLQHIRKVLRLPVGEQIELLDGSGAVARCELATLTAAAGNARVLEVRIATAAPLQIELLQGIAKGDKLDLVLQKGTELGTNRFIISAMERSVGRLREERISGKRDRWQRIIQEASRQCGQPYLPSVAAAPDFPTALKTCSGELKLMLWEEETQPLPEILPVSAPRSISVLIGPEGGLSKAEAEMARAAGFLSVRLGPRILRTETAGLAIISILQYLYGDLASGAMNI